MCSSEHVSSSWGSFIAWAVGSLCASSTASLAISRVRAAICVLDVAWVVVLAAVSAGMGTVVDGDVSVGTVGLGCIRGGQGLNWGAVGRVGSECHRF